MDGGDSEHELTAPLADRRRVFDRHIGNRLHPNSEAHRAWALNAAAITVPFMTRSPEEC